MIYSNKEKQCGTVTAAQGRSEAYDMSITIKDVARDTGLSTATISKYLNHKPVSSQNRELIEKSIQKLHYVPNRAAQGLRSRVSHSVCIFMPDLSNYKFCYICSCIAMEMKNSGFSTMVRTYSVQDPMQDILFLKKRQIDGVILFTETAYPSSLILQLNMNKIPYVCMQQMPDVPSDFVGCSDEASGAQAAEYLYRCGHTKAALLGLDSYSSARRIRGFLDAMQAHGVAADEQAVYLHSAETRWDETWCSSTFGSPKQTAVVLLDHSSTLQTIGYFIRPKADQPIPALLAFDDDELFTAISPSLTVIDQDSRTVGRKAAELLLKRIGGDFSDFPAACLVDPILIERESVMKR